MLFILSHGGQRKEDLLIQSRKLEPEVIAKTVVELFSSAHSQWLAKAAFIAQEDHLLFNIILFEQRCAVIVYAEFV